MSERAYNLKSALPNKVLDEDGNTTDLFGNAVTPTSEAYKNKPSLPNKWLNSDGTYSTLTEIIAGAIDTDVFVIVDELPAEGNPKKIYLVPDGEGGFNEYHYINGKWDPVGTIDMSISPQVFYWDGNTQQAGLDFWNNIYQLQKTQPCLVYTRYTQNNKSITQHWLYNNDMPTSASEMEVSYSVYTPSGMQMINNSYSQISRYTCQLYFTITDDQVTAISMNTHTPSSINYIDATGYYPTPFIPSSPSSPATKKYVDDHIGKSPVFFWDGYSSTTNANNITLWQQIYDAQLDDDCIVFHKWDVSSASTKLGYFVIKKQSFYDDYQNRIYSTSGETEVIHSASTSSITSDKYNVRVTIAAGIVTAVSELQTEHQSKSNVLSCSQNYATPYTPLYDGSPATKKYVDDSFLNSYVNIPVDVMQLTEESTPEEIFAAFGGKQKLQDIIVELRKGKYAYFVDINEEYDEQDDEQSSLVIGSSFTFITTYSINSVSPDMIEIVLYWRDGYSSSIMFLGVGYEDDELTVISDDVGINRMNLEFPLLENVLVKGNTTPFTPSEDYDPATKKYVDDKIANSITLALGGEY